MDREQKLQRLLDIIERIVFVHGAHDVPTEVEGLEELKQLINDLRSHRSKTRLLVGFII